MPKVIDIQEFIAIRAGVLLIDVRSPKEFAQGHILGAVNLPLFNDAERAIVGTIYKKQGKDLAIIKGLEIVGPKMSGYVKKVTKWCPDKKLIVHCWRGGKRSGSFAWLMELVGFEVFVLEGGYKKYRQLVLSDLLQSNLSLIVIGGRTGSGKTELLQAMARLGEQIIDLEALANHKGSAFGWIGEAAQPSVEHFENLLFEKIQSLDPKQRIWVENESRSIGMVFLPDGFWQNLKKSPLVNIEIPTEVRIQKLIQAYAHCGKEVLVESFKKIEKKLGFNHCKAAIDAVNQGDLSTAATIALQYYDKTYGHSLAENPTEKKYFVAIGGQNGCEDAEIVRNLPEVRDLFPS